MLLFWGGKFGRLETAVDDVCFFTASKDLDRRQVRIASWLGRLETCHVVGFFLLVNSKYFSPRALVQLHHLGHVSDLFEPCGDLRWRLRELPEDPLSSVVWVEGLAKGVVLPSQGLLPLHQCLWFGLFSRHRSFKPDEFLGSKS